VKVGIWQANQKKIEEEGGFWPKKNHGRSGNSNKTAFFPIYLKKKNNENRLSFSKSLFDPV